MSHSTVIGIELNNINVAIIVLDCYVEPFVTRGVWARAMASLNRKCNEARNQYVQSPYSSTSLQGLGNKVSEVIHASFNHADLETSPLLPTQL